MCSNNQLKCRVCGARIIIKKHEIPAQRVRASCLIYEALDAANKNRKKNNLPSLNRFESCFSFDFICENETLHNAKVTVVRDNFKKAVSAYYGIPIPPEITRNGRTNNA